MRNMADIERIRKLAERLDERRASGARLVPAAATMAAQALRVYADMLERPKPQDDLNQAFTVEVIDDHDHIEETLAKVSNVIVAQAAFAAACSQRPGRNVVLRQGARVLERAGTE